MPYRTNTFYTDPAIAQGVNNLAAALFGNPAQDAQLEYTLSQARNIQQKARLEREARDRVRAAADLFGRGDVTAGMSELVGTGDAAYLSNMGDAALAFRANTPETTDDEIRRAFIGAGKNPSQHFATTAARADEIADRDARASMAESEAVQRLRNRGSIEGLTAERVGAGEMSLDEAARLFDPLSVDQRIALEAPDAETAGRLRGYRDRSGGEDDPGIDWLEAQRRQALQDQLQTEALNQLIDMGLPVEGKSARTDLLPPGMLVEVAGEAWSNMLADLEANRQPAPAGVYVNQALSRRVGGLDYTDDNNWVPFFGEEELSVRPPVSSVPATPTQQQPATQAVPPPAQRVSGKVYDTPRGPMVWYVDPQTGESGWLPGS